MKKKVLITLLVFVLLALLVTPAFANKPGAGKYRYYQTGDVLPVPPYGSIDIPGSSGKLNVNQPKGDVELVLNTRFKGLKPNYLYRVYLMNLTCPGAPGWSYSHRGCWTQVGSFTTDLDGHGSFHKKYRNGDLSPGTYNLSVWVNDGSAGRTILVSDNFKAVID